MSLPKSSNELPLNENPFLKNQVNAIIRARYLLDLQEPTKNYSIEEVVESLVSAEKRAQFMCGFELLRESSETIAELKKYMVNKGYLDVVHQEKILLTNIGKTRADISLPDQIEKFF